MNTRRVLVVALASAGAVAIAAGVVVGSVTMSRNVAEQEQAQRVSAAFEAAQAMATPAPTPVIAATPSIAEPVATPAGTRAAGDPTAYDPAVYATNAAAGVLSPMGPEEAGQVACMASLGYAWNWRLGQARATAELAAATAATDAGGSVRDDATRDAERTAAAAALGIGVDQLDAYDAALVGVMNNDLSSCDTTASLGVQPGGVDAYGGWGPDWWNQTAIQATCLAEHGFTLTPEQRVTLRTVGMAPVDPASTDPDQVATTLAESIGWDLVTYNDYQLALYGATADDYRWEEAGCAGFATHAVGKDNAN